MPYHILQSPAWSAYFINISAMLNYLNTSSFFFSYSFWTCSSFCLGSSFPEFLYRRIFLYFQSQFKYHLFKEPSLTFSSSIAHPKFTVITPCLLYLQNLTQYEIIYFLIWLLSASPFSNVSSKHIVGTNNYFVQWIH